MARTLPSHPGSEAAKKYIPKADLARDLAIYAYILEAGRDPVSTVTALKEIDTTGFTFGASSRYVEGLGVFQWDPTSTATADDIFIVQPLNVTGPGRWTRAAGSGGAPISFVDFADQTGQTIAYAPGRTYYANDSLNTMTDFSNVVIQNGEELQQPVVNKSGGTILNGTPVYVQGAQGDRLAVDLPTSTDPSTIAILGLATHDFDNNQNGRVTTVGLVRDLDTSTWAAGTVLYVDGLGTLTSTRPTAAGSYVARVAVVTTQHPTAGVLSVSIHIEPIIASNTAGRPGTPRVGEMWFDTDLGHPIWWSGAAWVDSTGASV